MAAVEAMRRGELSPSQVDPGPEDVYVEAEMEIEALDQASRAALSQP